MLCSTTDSTASHCSVYRRYYLRTTSESTAIYCHICNHNSVQNLSVLPHIFVKRVGYFSRVTTQLLKIWTHNYDSLVGYIMIKHAVVQCMYMFMFLNYTYLVRTKIAVQSFTKSYLPGNNDLEWLVLFLLLILLWDALYFTKPRLIRLDTTGHHRNELTEDWQVTMTMTVIRRCIWFYSRTYFPVHMWCLQISFAKFFHYQLFLYLYSFPLNFPDHNDASLLPAYRS